MFKQPLPLRTRLALGYTAFFVLVLALLGVGVFFTMRDILRRELQLTMRQSGVTSIKGITRNYVVTRA